MNESLTREDPRIPMVLEELRGWLTGVAITHARANSGTYEDGEQLAERVYTQAIQRWYKGNPPKNVKAYLRRAVKNTWIDTARSRDREFQDLLRAADFYGTTRAYVPERDAPHVPTEDDLRTVKIKVKTARGGTVTVDAPPASEVKVTRLPSA